MHLTKIYHSQSLLGTLLIYFCLVQFGLAQDYRVSDYQKINASHGGFTGPLDNFDNWGVALDNIGDLDGNGVNDLAVGAFGDDDGGTDKGAVWILFLDANDQVIRSTKISETRGNFTPTLDPNDRFGGGVSYLGDLNNDARPELAVTADYDGDGGYWHGAFYILSLEPDGSVAASVKISDTQGGFEGTLYEEAIFGTDVANIGDLDGDGVTDLAVTARGNHEGGGRKGSLFILFMNPDLSVREHTEISEFKGNFNEPLDDLDYFGGAVLNLGDLDGDGVTDLAVGSYRDDDNAPNAGSLYILFLRPDGSVRNSQKVSNQQGGLVGGLFNEALFGESIDGTTDLDGDGLPEILVGAMKQPNPINGQRTGGFFHIELNRDGTVSEERFYTYGAQCFSGSLNSGDLFGGSVSVLQDGPAPKFAIGAYHDSENGPDQGAVWILNLGAPQIGAPVTRNPSACAAEDGALLSSGLEPLQDYRVSYTFEGQPYTAVVRSDATGQIDLEGLGAGTYEDLTLEMMLTGCSQNHGDLTLETGPLKAAFSTRDPTACGSSDGALLFRELNENTTYEISFYYEAQRITHTLTSDGEGLLTVGGLQAGSYGDLQVQLQGATCVAALGDFLLQAPGQEVRLETTSASACGAQDGSLRLADLMPAASYRLAYEIQGKTETQVLQADDQGVIFLDGIRATTFEHATLTHIANECLSPLGDIRIDQPALQLEYEVQDPTDCRGVDGGIWVAGLQPTTTYTIKFRKGQNDFTVTEVADEKGELVLGNLQAGSYEEITFEHPGQDCTATLANLDLRAPEGAVIEASVIHPTVCESSDGVILFSGLVPGDAYELRYTLGGESFYTELEADPEGNFDLRERTAGILVDLVFTHKASLCESFINAVEISCTSNFEGCFETRDFFTPNGDTYNDTWELILVNDCDYQLYIYDRFGRLMALLTPANPSWDGRFQGREMPEADYWYQLEYEVQGQLQRYHSHFALKR